MPRKWIVLFLLMSLMFGVVSQSVDAQAQYAVPILVVNTSFLNVRSGDGPQYSVVVTVVGGTELSVLGTNGDNSWYLVSTPVGPGWVDVSFTLPRGDFSHVPELTPQAPAQPSLSTPLTIGLPTMYYPPIYTISPESGIPSGARAFLEVISVNLRTQPGDSAPIIGVLYKDPDLAVDYAIVGYAYDEVGVPWVAIIVPTLGTGWIEAPKITVRTDSTSAAAESTSTTAPVPALEVPRVIINTSYQNIRLGPGAGFAVLTTVSGGTTLYVYGVTQDNSWYFVKGDYGQGWVSSQYVIFRGTFSNVPIIHNPY